MPAHQENHLRRLIVEGRDDGAAIRALLARHGADWDTPDPRLPYVHEARSVERAIHAPTLSAEIKLPRRRLGIVVDADDDVVQRWQQVRGALNSAGVTCVPVDLDPGGLVIAGPFDDQMIGVWMMPDNRRVGALESFLQELVPSNDAIWPHAGDATTEAMRRGAPLGRQDRLKGQMYAWLAWQSSPGRPFGTAIKAALLGHDTPVAARFVAWFDRLFDACGAPPAL